MVDLCNAYVCWSKLWNIHTILKHTHFAWRIFHDSLTTKDKLIHKERMIDYFCPRVGMLMKIWIMFSKIALGRKNVQLHSHLGIQFEDPSLIFVPCLEHVIS